MRFGRGIAASLIIVGVGGLGIVPSHATNIGNEGCTPGYWKNHTDNWEEYTTGDTLGAIFTFPAALSGYSSTTMLEALSLQGGPGVDGAAKILLRASTAAFLNAAHEGLGYPLRRFTDPGNIQALVNDALASGNRATMLALATYLDGLNNLGCPLN